MKYFDAFSGIAGFTRGIKITIPSAECVGYSEIDKYACAIYNHHYPDHRNYGDITNLIVRELPDFDLFCGGFPCQAFSLAGKRQGFKDARGTLFFDVARILQAKRPEWILLENVRNLLSHGGGATLATIYGILTDLGYTCGWEVVNSYHFGVPQNRERIFLIGHLGSKRTGKIFPIRESDKGDIQNRPESQRQEYCWALRSRDHKDGTNFVAGTWRTHKDGQGFRKTKTGLAPTIPARAREDGSGQPVIMLDKRIRRLTPVECERLQGFPDGWTAKGKMNEKTVKISDTQRYKTIGNSVTVNVISAIINKLQQAGLNT